MKTLTDRGYSIKETLEYPNGGKSEYYIKDDTAVIIDYDICSCNEKWEAFPYSLIIERQNDYMHKYDKVYRFLEPDSDEINAAMDTTKEGSNFEIKTADRGGSGEVSPLEFLFEKNFTNVYGPESIKYLNKEYCISDFEGNNYFLDYCLKTKEKDIAVEENGVSYHHPQIIGEQRYRNQLRKQNTCTRWGIKLFRFSSEDCGFEERIEDDIRSFFGPSTESFIESGMMIDRKVTLYEHQETCLEEMAHDRNQGKNTCLIVLPTATGKSKIIEEDIRSFTQQRNNTKILILAPNRDIINDWNERISESLHDLKESIDIFTYAYITRNYITYDSSHYDYIVIDEAHHAVAPVLKRVIWHFKPEFLVGITATDERLDKKRLEDVFGSYNTKLSLTDAMQSGIVARARVFRVETNIDLSRVRVNGKEYVNSDLEKNIRVTSRNQLIVDVIEKYFTEDVAGLRQGLIFCVNTRHTKEMARLLNERGINAAAYSSKEKHPERIMKDFKKKKIRFLCSCNMISEGWDYPELGILVMARPTLSKVLYTQQIGRGLRKTAAKGDVFVIDVVDEYGAMTRPCSMHSIFRNSFYVPFAPITQRQFTVGDFVEIDGISERIERIMEIDVNDFEDLYGDYLSEEQLAREYFVSTGTVTSWIRNGKIVPSATIPFGSRKLNLFSPENVAETRARLNIPVHDDSTVYEDFFAFLHERDYSLSYKMVFLTSLINNMNSIGEASIDDVLDEYIEFYKERLKRGLPADRKNCPYNEAFLAQRNLVKNNMLTNPFEKFERKRFIYYSKDLNVIAMNHALFNQLKDEDFDIIRVQMKEDLENYFSNINL